MGFTIADVGHKVSWRVLVNFVRYSRQDSALFRAMYGEQGRWSDTEQLLASVLDALRILVWFGSEDGSKNRNRPKPTPRPGVSDKDELAMGADAIPVSDFNEWWDA